jgi:sortase A
MSPEQERMLLLSPPDEGDEPEQALRRIAVGVSVLERGLAKPEQPQGTDDDLMMASLALSLERLARDARPAAATDEQRQRLAEAAGRIREVIDELAERERRRLHAVSAGAPAVPAPAPAAAVPAAPQASAPLARAVPERAQLLRIAGTALVALSLAVALFIAYEFVYTGQVERRSQRSLLSTFQQRLAAGQFDAPDAPVEGGPVAVVRIPAIGLEQVVVQGSSPEDLKQGPGHLPSSPLPGEFGNAVVIGHRLTYGGPFGDIGRLAEGDTIDVLTGQGHFTYTVTGVAVVKPGQPDVVGPSSDSRLTLVTSASAFGSDRRAVTATLKGDPLAVATRPPAAASSDELGTSGDVAGLYLALIWLAALAGLAVAAVRAYRAWPRMAAHLVTTPPLLMLLYLVYQSLSRFLPGTL